MRRNLELREKDSPGGLHILTSSGAEIMTGLDLILILQSWCAKLVHLNPALVHSLDSTVVLPCLSSGLTHKINAITLSGVVPLLLGLRQIVSEINSNF